MTEKTNSLQLGMHARLAFISCSVCIQCINFNLFFKIIVQFYFLGRNIWSLAVNQNEDLIATGGGDGSVRLWPLSSPDHDDRSTVREACLPSSNNTNPNKPGLTKKAKKEDYPRFVNLLDQSNLLVMTNEGYVMHSDQLLYVVSISYYELC